MITVEEALSRIRDNSKPLPAGIHSIQDSLGHLLARDVVAQDFVPGFDSSAVDGYGVKADDLSGARPDCGVRLRVQDTVPAGRLADRPLMPLSAVRIMTGAPIPLGVEAVVMQEEVELRPEMGDAATSSPGSSAEFSKPAMPGQNIRRRGEEFQPGDVVLRAGLRITPPVVAMLATLGQERVCVHRKPRLGLIVTGSELVAPSEPLRPGQIRDSNSYGISAAFASLNLPVGYIVRTQDDRESIKNHFALALEACDVVVLSGGVSVGDFDFVKQVTALFAVRTVYWGIAMKPGKPNYFGVSEGKLVFGLPGNPVAALLSFHLLVRPAIARLSGARETPALSLPAVLQSDLRKKPGRTEFVRAILRMEGPQLSAIPLSSRDSHMLGALAQANALISFPSEADFLPKGGTVQVIPLHWNELTD